MWVVLGLVGSVISYLLAGLVMPLLFLAPWKYPKDETLIAMFHQKRPELEQLRIMFENDTAPRFSQPEFISVEKTPGKLIKAIAARGVLVPEAPTQIDSLNRLLSGSSLHDKFSDIHVPKDAEPLLAQVSSLSEGERIKLNRLILQAVVPQECPKPGSKLQGVYDSSALGRWLGGAPTQYPENLDLIGVPKERIKQYQVLLRSIRYRSANIEGSRRGISITVYVVGLSIGGATSKGYVYRRSPPDTKEITPTLDNKKPKNRATFYRHLEGNWYLFLRID